MQSWADMMEAESPEIPPLFEELLEVETGFDEVEGDANSDILDMDKMEDVEDDYTSRVKESRPPSASDAASPVDSSLYKVCKRVTSKCKLGIQWPVVLDA